ncbi:MAG: DUF692 domain-containing protein [Cyanobacteria bacterium J06639_1]
MGLGFRSPLRADIFRHQSQIDFLEITADHFLDAPSEKLAELELLADHFTLIPHALNLSLGSAEGIDGAYVEKLAALVDRVNPPWWSDHLCFTRAGGVDIGHLSPLPLTQEAVDVVCQNIERVRGFIALPLLLENIAYTVQWPETEMTEAAFVSAVAEQADCGLLLDVANLYANSVNHEFDPVAFFEQLPRDRIVQLHFAGGHWHDGILIDSHAHPVLPAAWELMESVVRSCSANSCSVRGIILERDENFPAFTDILAELHQARTLVEVV